MREQRQWNDNVKQRGEAMAKEKDKVLVKPDKGKQ